MSKKPYLSVVIPVYNANEYLHACINSILLQNYKDYELILINDGSTDNSGEICDDYAERYESISVYHIENKGVANARNFGIKKSKGEYIHFVDSDDKLEPNMYLDYIKILRNNNYDIISSGTNVYNQSNQSNKLLCYSRELSLTTYESIRDFL